MNDQLILIAAFKTPVMYIFYIFPNPDMLQLPTVTECISAYSSHFIRQYQPFQSYSFKSTGSNYCQCRWKIDFCKSCTAFKYIVRQFLYPFRYCDALQLTVPTEDPLSCAGQALRIIDTVQAGTVGKTVSSKRFHRIRQLHVLKTCTLIKAPTSDRRKP